MFEHVTLLLSFVFAIALTHLMSSATELIQERRRVRFSGLHALWMLNALVGLLVNWLGIWQLTILKRWSVSDVMLQFAMAAAQYFTCSLISLRPEPGEPIDMEAFFARQRPVFLAAYAALMLISMIQNWVYRDTSAGIAPGAWITEELLCAPMLGALLIAQVSSRALQWAAGLALLAFQGYFLITFAVTD